MRPHPLLLAALLVLSCGTTRRDQLQRVAKDWCETIRASQVVPVYPLTEDLCPGDVFLVQQPVERQQVLYEQDGFLPLDYHLGRIEPSGYEAFYGARPARDAAPAAAFPTYSFRTARDGGFELALPVSGVPVGLGLLGAREATGTVAVTDARTIGLDVESLSRDVAAWAGTRSAFLAAWGRDDAQAGHANYLRVVSRVYLAGGVTTALHDAREREGDLSVTPAAAAAPAHLRVVASSERSIALEETFPRPLVIGYLGFDLRILPGGDLGPPIPTHAVLSGGARPEGGAFFTGDEQAYLQAMRGLRDADPSAWAAVLARLGIAGEPADYAAFRTLVGDWVAEGPAGPRLAAATDALVAAAARAGRR